MSAKLFSDDILFYQRILSVAGIYNGSLDGVWTSDVDEADVDFAKVYTKIASEIAKFDDRSEACIRTLLPVTQSAARQFLKTAGARFAKYSVRIISGSRTYAEQDQLYKRGRFGSSAPKVTNAKGGQSNHNFGIAWDVGIFDGGRYLEGQNQQEDKIYRDLAAATLTDNLEWGGNWKSIVDMPHYQLKTGLDLPTLRSKFEAGKSYF